MKILILSVITLLCAFALAAQTPNQFAAAGVSYSPGASPAIAGTGLYARSISESGTYAFTVLDALPATLKPFTVTTQTAVGIAQRVLSFNGVQIYVPTAAGVSYSGTNVGWAWTTGGLASIPIKRGWFAMPNVRVVKSSVSGGTGYQLIGGVLFGKGF